MWHVRSVRVRLRALTPVRWAVVWLEYGTKVYGEASGISLFSSCLPFLVFQVCCVRTLAMARYACVL